MKTIKLNLNELNSRRNAMIWHVEVQLYYVVLRVIKVNWNKLGLWSVDSSQRKKKFQIDKKIKIFA